MMRILVAEDDPELTEYLGRVLQEDNHSVVSVGDGGAAIQASYEQRFDAIVLDVMLPTLDGFEVTRRLRRSKVNTPILLLTARDADRDIVKGLDAGADDYITKPFSFDVLLARLRARTRDTSGEPQLVRGDLVLDSDRHEASRKGSAINLTRTEFSILECLLRASGRVVTRGHLIDTVWGAGADVTDNNLDVFIKRLRDKVDAPGAVCLIHTVRGIGFSVRGSPRV
jgi:DNA-binding response OmpR family regulator